MKVWRPLLKPTFKCKSRSALEVFCLVLRPVVRLLDSYFNVNQGLAKASGSEVSPLSCKFMLTKLLIKEIIVKKHS